MGSNGKSYSGGGNLGSFFSLGGPVVHQSFANGSFILLRIYYSFLKNLLHEIR